MIGKIEHLKDGHITFMAHKAFKEKRLTSQVFRTGPIGRITPARRKATQFLIGNLIAAVQYGQIHTTICSVKVHHCAKWYTKAYSTFSDDDLIWAKKTLLRQGLVTCKRGNTWHGATRLYPTIKFVDILPDDLLNYIKHLRPLSTLSNNTSFNSTNDSNLLYLDYVNKASSYGYRIRQSKSVEPTLSNPLILKLSSDVFQYYRKKKRIDGKDVGGRFVERTGLQRKRSEQRARLLIDGQETTELDYSGTFARILYGIVGKDCLKDPYEFEGQDRKSLKIAFNTLLVNSDEGTFKKSIQQKKNFKKIKLTIPVEDLKAFFVYQHPYIADYFLTLDGAQRLQCVESRIAEQVMMIVASFGAPIHCVHDSFIVRKCDEDLLHEAMEKAWVCVMTDINPNFAHKAPPICKKY